MHASGWPQHYFGVAVASSRFTIVVVPGDSYSPTMVVVELRAADR